MSLKLQFSDGSLHSVSTIEIASRAQIWSRGHPCDPCVIMSQNRKRIDCITRTRHVTCKDPHGTSKSGGRAAPKNYFVSL